jgi:aarF domain-containing kinase
LHRYMEDAGVASAIGVLFSALAKGGGADGFRSELGLPDQDKIKEIQKELKGIKDPTARRDAFIEASGGAESKAGLYKCVVLLQKLSATRCSMETE